MCVGGAITLVVVVVRVSVVVVNCVVAIVRVSVSYLVIVFGGSFFKSEIRCSAPAKRPMKIEAKSSRAMATKSNRRASAVSGSAVSRAKNGASAGATTSESSSSARRGRFSDDMMVSRVGAKRVAACSRASATARTHTEPSEPMKTLQRGGAQLLHHANASRQPSVRHIFGLSLKRKAPPQSGPTKPKILEQDDLFHPLSRSPFPSLRARGESVRSMAPCPVCLEEHGERTPVAYECPDCGWPTHASEEHWKSDKQHAKYCARLREANEDEHDLRSGRKIWEFELPGTSKST